MCVYSWWKITTFRRDLALIFRVRDIEQLDGGTTTISNEENQPRHPLRLKRQLKQYVAQRRAKVCQGWINADLSSALPDLMAKIPDVREAGFLV